MTTKLIFAVGTGENRATSYVLGGDRFDACFSALATRHFHDRQAALIGEGPIEEAFVLVTPGAREVGLPALLEAWDPCIPLSPLDAPDGGDVEDQWGLFDAIAAVIHDGDRIVLDITRGFRSLPLVALLVVAFMRAAHPNARLAMLTYGALEARSTEGTPLVDLTPMTSLLDWAAAVHRFQRGGDAQALAALVKETNRAIHRRGASVAAADRPRHLGALATDLDRFAAGLQTFRYEDTAALAPRLQARLRDAFESDPDRRAVRPLFILRSRLEAGLEPFKPADQTHPLADLRHQRHLLQWLYERGLYLQYTALLAELLVGWVAQGLGLVGLGDGSPTQHRQIHQFAEKVLRGAAKQLAGETPEALFMRQGEGLVAKLAELDYLGLVERLFALPHGPEVVEFAERVRPLRNSLMHAGMSTDQAPSDGPGIREKIEGFHQQVQAAVYLSGVGTGSMAT